MLFTSWLRDLRSALALSQMGRTHKRPLRAATHRPYLELLEDRCLLSFSPAGNYPAGSNPRALLTADFNGDARLDLAVVNHGDSKVSVLLGNGDGTFTAGPASVAGANPQSVAVGDFNADGRLDLATASTTELNLLLGNGDGTFQAPQRISLGSDQTSVAVGDFNADGKLDLGVTWAVYDQGTPGFWYPDPYYGVYYPGIPGHYEGRVTVLLGNGDGTFQPPQTSTAPDGGFPSSLAVADFNADGKPDAVTASDNGNLSVLLGNGNGTFQSARSFSPGGPARSVAVGDFNGDSHADLVTGGIFGFAACYVLLGNGDGTFQPGRGHSPGTESTGVVVSDFDADGTPDILTTNQNGSVSVLLGVGDGTFQPARDYANGSYVFSPAVGDFDGDGFLDLAVVKFGVNPVIAVLINDTNWATDLHFDAVSYPAGAYPHAVLTADFDGDARLDLAVVDVIGSETVSVLLGNGDGTFQPALTSATGGYVPISLAVGDFDGDGNLDLTTANRYDMSVLLGNGDGTFQAPISVPVGGGQSVAVGDLNADGKLDLVVMQDAYFPGTPTYYDPYPAGHWEGRGNVLLGNGDGTFQPAQTFTTGPNGRMPSGRLVAVADFNVDQMLDIVTASDNGTVSVLLGNGDGTLQPAQDYATGFLNRSVAVADFNGDGKADVVTANSESSTVSVLLGNGFGAFGAARIYAVGAYPTEVAVADFNGDGKADLVTANHGAYADSVSVLLGNGDGTFQPAWGYYAGIYPMSVAVADFNGDGLTDLAVTNYYSGVVSVLLNVDDGAAPAPSISINDVTVTEGNTGTVSATFTVSLSTAYGQQVTVHYETANGSATAGSDYMPKSGDVTFGIGETSKTITVLVNGDTLYEPDESFFINLATPTNAVIADGSGTGTIQNDDPTPPSLVISDVSVMEGNTGTVNATFTLTLSHASNVDVTVRYDTADITAVAGSDYTAASGEVTIAAGQTSQTFTVAVIGDRLVDPTETFAVNLSAPTNATIADGQGVGTIIDDEPRISISDVTKKEGNGKKTTLFTFTVTLSAAYDQPVTMSYRTADGTATTNDSDYVAKTGTLTFAPGETTKTITIEVKADSKREAKETFYLDLFDNSGNSLFTKNRGAGTIVNDD